MTLDSTVGLTEAEARHYLEVDGPNLIGRQSGHAWISILIRQFTSPSIAILSFTALIYGLLGNLHDSAILFAIIIPSGLLTFVQEFRAAAIMKQLQERLSTAVIAIRDGKECEVSIESLVKGDVIRLSAGDPIPADLLLLESSGLLVDESLLTGESIPVEKSVEAEGAVEIYKGTFIAGGSCLARVIRTGVATRFGEIAHRLSARDTQTSFEKGIRKFGLLVARAIFALVILVFLGNLALDRPVFSSLLFSLALAVGLTPQMLPVIISICLSRGARELAAEKVLVRRLDAIEDLGSLDVLCTDKTGTLTEGRLQLQGNFDPLGRISERTLQLGYENACYAAASSNVIDKAILATNAIFSPREKIRSIPFTFNRRIVTVTMSDGESITKGAVKEVLARSTQARVAGREIPISEVKKEIDSFHDELVSQGFKVIAIATSRDSEHVEESLTFEGFLSISDPIKSDAKSSVERLRNLGVRVVLVTGDNLDVARYVARKVAISEEVVLTGSDLEGLSEGELAKIAQRCDVFAEINPHQKVAIVEALRSSGHATGFLGDGINDAMALKVADVSISVDDASEIARGVSSVVLLENDLDVIADGVLLGRKTYLNTVKYIKITISASFGNVLSVALASLFLPFLPMLPTQILLLNFLSDLPAIAISGDSVDEEAAATPRSWSMRGLGHFMIFFGLISTFFDLLLFFVVIISFDGGAVELRSLWFSASLITEAIAIYTLRTNRRSWHSSPSKILMALTLLIIAAAFLLPITGVLTGMGIAPFSLSGFLLVSALAIGYLSAVEIGKRRSGVMI
jgi:Mg2+-importing ATPase